jgi:hypothetical protein
LEQTEQAYQQLSANEVTGSPENNKAIRPGGGLGTDNFLPAYG